LKALYSALFKTNTDLFHQNGFWQGVYVDGTPTRLSKERDLPNYEANVIEYINTTIKKCCMDDSEPTPKGPKQQQGEIVEA